MSNKKELWQKPDSNDYHVNAFIFSGLDHTTAVYVGRFAKALANKLRAAKDKYGYTDGWASSGWEEQCRASLMEHIGKGDPIDVAAFAMFMWKHNWSTTPEPASPGNVGRAQKPMAYRYKLQQEKYWQYGDGLPTEDFTDFCRRSTRELQLLYASPPGLSEEGVEAAAIDICHELNVDDDEGNIRDIAAIIKRHAGLEEGKK